MQRYLKIAILLFVSVVFTLAALVAIGVLVQRSTESHNRRVYEAPGKMIVVDDIELHAYKVGEGEPKVVFENGLGDLFFEWGKVPELLSTTYSVLLYDRAGLGWSDPGPNAKNSSEVIKELRILLHKTGRQRVVLVGKDFGALAALHSAFKFKQIIAGVVLIEPIPADVEFMKQLLAETDDKYLYLNKDWWNSELGLHRLNKRREFRSISDRYPDTLRRAAKAKLIDHKHVQNSIKEYSALPSTAKMVLAGNEFKHLDIPIFVIRQNGNASALPENFQELRETWYQDIKQMSPYAKEIEMDNAINISLNQAELLAGIIQNAVHVSDSIYTNSLITASNKKKE